MRTTFRISVKNDVLTFFRDPFKQGIVKIFSEKEAIYSVLVEYIGVLPDPARPTGACGPSVNPIVFAVESNSPHVSPIPGVGNFDDGEGHYILTFTPEGHYAYRVKNI